jgi:hypothetical protein
MITFVVEHYFVLDNSVETAGVIAILIKCYEADIGLFELRIFIINDENNSFVESIIEKILKFSQLLGGIAGCELGKVASIFIKVAIEIIESVELPVEIVVLNFVLPKRHLKAIVKLTMCI